MTRILLLPHIKIQNANALSSPYTIGFPAMTAWLGAVHALQRKLNSEFESLSLDAVGVVSHEINLQAYKGKGDYVYSIIATANPLKRSKKTGKYERPPFIEEARCHLNVSLVLEYQGVPKDDDDAFLQAIRLALHSGMKMASGDILDFNSPEVFTILNVADVKKLTRKLMPGYALIERRDLMNSDMQSTGKDAFDVMLDYLTIKHRSEKTITQQGKEKVSWRAFRKIPGWIVPIATGFHGISEVGLAKNQRDPNMPHRFVESVITLGEFIMPYRIDNLDHMLWHYHVDLDKSLYLCQQKSFNH